MGLFGKKNKSVKSNATERNEIENRELKNNLVHTALSLLKQGEHYNDLAYTEIEFGYLFDIDGHGLEALFKITTDKGTFYFAAQKQSLIMLDFNDELFQTTTEGFLDLHS